MINFKDIDEDIKGLKYVLDNNLNDYNRDRKKYEMYDSIYPYNNEGIDEYYNFFDYSGPILTVASSGDHMLHAILSGATDITLFDINRLTKYFCMLKLAAVKTLSYEEFFSYFGTFDKYTLKLIRNLKSGETYSRIREKMNEEDMYFWDQVYSSYLIEYIEDKLFEEPFSCINNAYYDEKTYNILQNKALGYKKTPLFINTDFLELISKLDPNKKYSSIFLSNIGCYVDKRLFRDSIIELKNYLLDGCMIQTEYFPIKPYASFDLIPYYPFDYIELDRLCTRAVVK